MNKKGIELTLNTVVLAIIVMVVLAVMLVIFSGLVKQGGNPLSCASKALGADSDGDNVNDAADPCPYADTVPRECNGPVSEQPPGCPGTSQRCPINCGFATDPACKPESCS